MAKLTLIERIGFTKVRQTGSHARYKSANGKATVIPIHSGDLKRPLIRDILNQVGLSVEEYEVLRKEI